MFLLTDDLYLSYGYQENFLMLRYGYPIPKVYAQPPYLISGGSYSGTPYINTDTTSSSIYGGQQQQSNANDNTLKPSPLSNQLHATSSSSSGYSSSTTGSISGSSGVLSSSLFRKNTAELFLGTGVSSYEYLTDDDAGRVGDDTLFARYNLSHTVEMEKRREEEKKRILDQEKKQQETENSRMMLGRNLVPRMRPQRLDSRSGIKSASSQDVVSLSSRSQVMDTKINSEINSLPPPPFPSIDVLIQKLDEELSQFDRECEKQERADAEEELRDALNGKLSQTEKANRRQRRTERRQQRIDEREKIKLVGEEKQRKRLEWEKQKEKEEEMKKRTRVPKTHQQISERPKSPNVVTKQRTSQQRPEYPTTNLSEFINDFSDGNLSDLYPLKQLPSLSSSIPSSGNTGKWIVSLPSSVISPIVSFPLLATSPSFLEAAQYHPSATHASYSFLPGSVDFTSFSDHERTGLSYHRELMHRIYMFQARINV
jgi:hypothetical protein